MRKIWTGLILGLMISACDKKSEEAKPPAVTDLRQVVESSLQPFAKNRLERSWLKGRWQDELDYRRLVNIDHGGYLIPWRSKKHERDTVSWAGLFCLPHGSNQVQPLVMEYYGRDEHIDCHSMQLAMKSATGAADGTYRLLRPDGKLIIELNYEKGELSTLKKLERRMPATQGRAAQRQAKCLQWFLITTHYNTDGTVEVYEDYLGTTCEGCDYYDFLNQLTGCSGSESGTGGSSSSECSESQEAQSFSTAEALPAVMRPITMKEREVDCSWIFYRNTFNIWYFKSLETGRQYQLYKKWYWKSFKHVGVMQQGYAFGVSVSCEVLSSRTSFNDEIAVSELNFKITKSVLCKDFPITFWDTGVESEQFYASAL